MSQLKLAASKIPIGLFEKLTQVTELTGLTQSAVVRKAIEYYLSNAEITKITALTPSEVKPSELVATANLVNSRLTEIEARLTVIENRSVMPMVNPIAAGGAEPNTTPNTTPNTESIQGDRIGTKEAFEILQSKGYGRSRATFERRLKESKDCGELPQDLIALGLCADFKLARSKNPKDAFDRWLWIG